MNKNSAPSLNKSLQSSLQICADIDFMLDFQ